MSRRHWGALLLGAWATSCLGNKAGDDARPDIADYLITPPSTEHWRPGEMLALRPAYASLAHFTDPVALARPDTDDGHLYVVERGGRLLRFADHAAVTRTMAVFDLSLEVTGTGTGLRAVAFHPDYPRDPRIFSYRVTEIDGSRSVVIASHVIQPSGVTGAPRELLRVGIAVSRVSGDLAFTSAGELLVAVGAADAAGSGIAPMPGRVLRVGLHPASPAGERALTAATKRLRIGESAVFARGLHAPASLSRDRRTGQLWLIDRGATSWDELNNVVAGRDFGSPIREGHGCVGAPKCGSAGLTAPVAVHRRDAGAGIVGGFVYRGSDAPMWVGSYLYAEKRSGRIFAVDVNNPRRVPAARVVVETKAKIIALGEDRRGELLVLDGEAQQIYRLRNSGLTAAETRP